MPIVITEKMIADLISETENTPPDLRPAIQRGDWILFDIPDYMEFYRSGHVAWVEPSGYRLRFGKRDDLDRYVSTGYVPADTPLVEHWRRIHVVVREPNAVSIEYRWVQIQHEEQP